MLDNNKTDFRVTFFTVFPTLAAASAPLEFTIPAKFSLLPDPLISKLFKLPLVLLLLLLLFLAYVPRANRTVFESVPSSDEFSSEFVPNIFPGMF